MTILEELVMFLHMLYVFRVMIEMLLKVISYLAVPTHGLGYVCSWVYFIMLFSAVGNHNDELPQPQPQVVRDTSPEGRLCANCLEPIAPGPRRFRLDRCGHVFHER